MRKNDLYPDEYFTNKADWLAVISLICGIASICIIFDNVRVSIVFAIVAIASGIRSKNEYGKKCSLAKYGVILGGIGIVVDFAVFIFALINLSDFFALSGQ